ncbi:transglycosylase domain-containing protein [Paenibacillus protaetiae]|uniref:Carboxypeptidase n=1 Tax=Paenibacillus protaetiae TaxID=2509456 RepID=A0A4P6ESE8_9BACL|nr:transglycosylase domain-containing protein [Paenibacillus protaetiae]QAY65486.1 carboxypeptidase [Paenibacillus protaetiae]
MQEDRKPSPPRKGKWRTFGIVSLITVKWLVYFAIFIALLVGGALTGYVAALVKDEPVRPRALIEEKVNENSITGFVYFNDGSLVGQLRTEEDRLPITYEDLPQNVINAVVATEDNNFFEHHGVDISGLGRAVKQKLLNEDTQTGGSTLTQQLARRVFLSLDKTDSRKVKEIFLALRMERYLTKPEILTAYLNKVPFGNGSTGYNLYGIKAAAKGIFNIDDLKSLNIAQAAYLAGLPQRPSAYTAFTSKGEFNEDGFKLAVERQGTVLTRMLETGRITQAEYDEAKAFDLRSSLAKPAKKAYTTYPYLMLESEREAAQILLLQQNKTLTQADLSKPENATLLEESREQLLHAGYHIYTTIDPAVYQIMQGISSNPDNFSPDSKTKGMEQTAAVMIDHKTGAILGMIEGRDFYEEQMNFATQMTRQPGSAMKVLAAYLPAIDKGMIQPASILDDSPMVLKDGQKGFHIPKNSNDNYRGLVTARDALNRSLNLPALKIFNDKVTIKNAWDFVRNLGITTLQPEDEYAQTGVIGGLSKGVTVEEMTNAYGSIPNNGVFNDAYMIDHITDADGNIVYQHQAAPKKVFSEQTAFLMTDMLRTVVSSSAGTAHSLVSDFKNYKKIPIAGKTGTTQSYGDVWFMGFTPDITLGVWAGYEKQAYSLSDSGKKRARSIWADIMNEVTSKKPDLFPTKEFSQPSGIVKATVSSASGLLPSQLAKDSGMLVTDWFNKPFIPTKTDESLVNMQIVTYNGVNYIPNPATPADMTQQKLLIKREKPLDELMDEIQAAQDKLPASSRRNMSYYLPMDADKSAPSKQDPRTDDGQPPAAPTNVAINASGGNVTISFAASTSEDVVGYRVYETTDGVSFQQAGNSILAGNPYETTISLSGMQAAAFYVKAVDVAGHESSPSTTVQYGGILTPPTMPPAGDGNGEDSPETTPGGNNHSGTDMTAPDAPSGLHATNSGSSYHVTWNANAAGESVIEYNVYFKGKDGDFKLISSVSDPSVDIQAPMGGSVYVTAKNLWGESSPSKSINLQ